MNELKGRNGNAWIATHELTWISPLKFTPKGRGHHFVAIKRGVLRKSYRMAGFQWFFLLTKWWGRVHQPAPFITPPFCREVYLAQMFDSFSWVWILLACLDLVPQKRHHFVRTSFSAISLRFSHLSLRSNPSFLYGNGLNDTIGVSLKRSYPCFCCLRGELCWKAGLTGTSGNA